MHGRWCLEQLHGCDLGAGSCLKVHSDFLYSLSIDNVSIRVWYILTFLSSLFAFCAKNSLAFLSFSALGTKTFLCF
jgi:hypothetical protein